MKHGSPGVRFLILQQLVNVGGWKVKQDMMIFVLKPSVNMVQCFVCVMCVLDTTDVHFQGQIYFSYDVI